MNAALQPHPSTEQLLAFAHGRLREPEFAQIEQHLSACDVCCAWIGEQPDNTLVALAREAATVGLRTSGNGGQAHAAGEIPAALHNHPRYRVIQQIGVGGMGSVFKAEHRLMQRTVALKIVHPWLLSNPQAVERFQREVRVAAQLAHPNIVVSYDADRAEDMHFLVMEFVAGETLDARVARQGPPPVQQACDWIRQAALGLQHAHEQGMVHRDIKPHNLMLASDGQLKILDFGLSRVVAERTIDAIEATEASAGPALPAPTHAGTILGTPDYIAPEQIANSRTADIRSDIYSLGCTLYFLLTGHPPFIDSSVAARLHAHETAPFPGLERVRPDAPRKLAEILARMTAKRPADRYATPGEVARDLALLSADATDREPSPAAAPVPPPLAGWPSIGPPLASNATPKPRRAFPFSLVAVAGFVAAACGLLLTALTSLGYLTPSKMLAPQPPMRMLVMLPSRGLWFPDYQELVDAARGTGTELIFASVSDEPSETLYTSVPGVAVADVKLDAQVRAEDFDAIIFIGYDTSEFSPRGLAGAETKRLINEFQRQKKVLASLCTGQRILAQHGALRGKQVAPCKEVKNEEIAFKGGTRTDRPIAADGLVVTATSASDAPEFLRAIAKSRLP